MAHAATLTVATLGIVSLSPRLVEPLIALSIAYVAIENVLTDRLTRWRPVVVFVFGLLHGLGFAGVLGELGLPEHERLLALVTFNVGIEVGQLAVIAAAAGSFGWFRSRPWYRRRSPCPSPRSSAWLADVGHPARLPPVTGLFAPLPAACGETRAAFDTR